MRTIPTTPRRSFSTRELQAAATALEEGQFAEGQFAGGAACDAPDDVARDGDGDGDVSVVKDPWPACRPPHGTVAPARKPPVFGGKSTTVWGSRTSEGQGTVQLPPATSLVPPGDLVRLVRVRAASSGAGASTITLAIADAAASLGARCRVLDAAAPGWSGLSGATSTELGVAHGWRRGRRGEHITIDRVAGSTRTPSEISSPRAVGDVDLTVLDAGWSVRELATLTGTRTGTATGTGTGTGTAAGIEIGSWLVTTPAAVEVLVTRGHRLALSQTEAALSGLRQQLTARQVVVVVVGANRRNRLDIATTGPRLARADQQDAVVLMPLLADRTLPTLGPGPLPRQISHPAQRLLKRITTITGPLTQMGPERRSHTR